MLNKEYESLMEELISLIIQPEVKDRINQSLNNRIVRLLNGFEGTFNQQKGPSKCSLLTKKPIKQFNSQQNQPNVNYKNQKSISFCNQENISYRNQQNISQRKNVGKSAFSSGMLFNNKPQENKNQLAILASISVKKNYNTQKNELNTTNRNQLNLRKNDSIENVNEPKKTLKTIRYKTEIVSSKKSLKKYDSNQSKHFKPKPYFKKSSANQFTGINSRNSSKNRLQSSQSTSLIRGKKCMKSKYSSSSNEASLRIEPRNLFTNVHISNKSGNLEPGQNELRMSPNTSKFTRELQFLEYIHSKQEEAFGQKDKIEEYLAELKEKIQTERIALQQSRNQANALQQRINRTTSKGKQVSNQIQSTKLSQNIKEEIREIAEILRRTNETNNSIGQSVQEEKELIQMYKTVLGELRSQLKIEKQSRNEIRNKLKTLRNQQKVLRTRQKYQTQNSQAMLHSIQSSMSKWK